MLACFNSLAHPRHCSRVTSSTWVHLVAENPQESVSYWAFLEQSSLFHCFIGSFCRAFLAPGYPRTGPKCFKPLLVSHRWVLVLIDWATAFLQRKKGRKKNPPATLSSPNVIHRDHRSTWVSRLAKVPLFSIPLHLCCSAIVYMWFSGSPRGDHHFACNLSDCYIAIGMLSSGNSICCGYLYMLTFATLFRSCVSLAL